VAWAYEQVEQARALSREGERKKASKRLEGAELVVRTQARDALPALMVKVEAVRRMLSRR